MKAPSWNNVVAHGDDDANSNSGRTEDSLISSRTSRETVNSTTNHKQTIAKYCQHKVRRQFCQYKLLIFSLILLIFGILQIIFPPYEVLMKFRIRMTPGFPPFDWWLDPPDQVVAKVYLFNITNSEKFLDGTDKKLKLQEVGPIIYREKLRHTNPTFNENGTLSYTSNRTLIYLPERNPVYLLNQTVTMPNIAVLFIASYLFDAPFFVRFGANLMIRRLKTEMFKVATIEDFLWNVTDPILDVSQNIAPKLVPKKNLGILFEIYQNSASNVTVYIGPKYSQRDFFRINKVDGSEYLRVRQPTCEDKVEGSSEGVTYFQQVTKNDTLKYFRKTICKIGDLTYASEMEKYGLIGYRYILTSRFYNRSLNLDEDCYKGHPVLPNGLIDLSQCHSDTSIAASNPHFLYGDSVLLNSVEGLNPDPALHTSFVDIEPNTGIPLQGRAQSQLNLVVKDMKGFNAKLHKFSNLNIPLVWIEYNQEGLPPILQWLLYLQVVILPICEKLFMVLTFIGALVVIILLVKRRGKCKQNLDKNRVLAFESEMFLKK